MAKRKTATLPGRRQTVTPTTKGADVSTQGRTTARHRFPIPAPATAAHADEESLYSQPSAALPRRSNLRVTPLQQEAARRRMLGDFDVDDAREGADPPDLDALGELDVVGDDPDVHPAMDFTAAVERRARELADERAQQEIAQADALKDRQARTATAAAPVAAAAATAPMLAAYDVTADDVDRLWDWLRSDRTGAAHFLGITPKHSLHLHQIIRAIHAAEEQGVGLIRSLYVEQGTSATGAASSTHFGFGMLAPILSADRLALMHVYLQPAVRGQLPRVLGGLVQLASGMLPGYKLAVAPFDDAQARLYQQLLQPLGFTTHTLFVR